MMMSYTEHYHWFVATFLSLFRLNSRSVKNIFKDKYLGFFFVINFFYHFFFNIMCQTKRIHNVVTNKLTRKLFVSIESLKHSHNHVGN